MNCGHKWGTCLLTPSTFRGICPACTRAGRGQPRTVDEWLGRALSDTGNGD